MRYVTANVLGSSTFVVSETGERWAKWEDFAKKFPTDKVLQETKTLFDFVKRSSVLVDHLKKHLNDMRNLSTHEVQSDAWELPFTPVMFRDFYCFEEHVKNARKGRGADMIPEWYEAPIFYYSNHLSFRGPFETLAYPKDSKELDLELEIAAIVGKEIRNASLEQARDAIFGYCLVNDWTARDFQRFEMKVNMGPAKGKDFATTFGSYILSADELERSRSGKGFDIELEALINNESLTKKNWKTIQFSFEEMLVRASKNCTVYPGEVIASGTMGGGCLMEHNVLAALENPNSPKRWLKKGDVVTLKWLPKGPTISNRIGDEK